MKYLLTQTTHFVDSRCTFDEGGVVKFISDSKGCELLKEDKFYTEEFDPEAEEFTDYTMEDYIKEITVTDKPHAEEGYNLQIWSYSVRKITEAQARQFEKIIAQHNEL